MNENNPTNETRGPVNGLEIYARKINNTGTFSSDTYAKIVTDDYSGNGTVVTKIPKKQSPEEKWFQKWWFQLILVLLGILGSLPVAYLVYKFKWNG